MAGPTDNGNVSAAVPGKRRGSITSQMSFSKLPSVVRQSIVIGCPTEIKVMEDRVGITPAAASEYIANSHAVVIQSGAGLGSGFTDEDYISKGCVILPTAEAVYASSNMIVKVKEPLPAEYKLIREGQIVFTYFHFAADKELTEAMIRQKAICIAYETVECADRSLPLLTPMSEIAGRMAIQEGAKYLEKPMGGRGVLLAGVPGVLPARILVVGGGVVGANAAKIAAGTGADVCVMDINIQRLRYLDDALPTNCRTLYCSTDNLISELKKADVVIGAVLIPGAKAPKLVKREHLKLMKKGSVCVDVAVDQGGCFESTRVTTHKEPTFVDNDVIHYCVGNMPGAVPNTSTTALNNVTLKYGLQIANKGWYEACKENEELKKGLNVVHGHVVYKGVSDAFGMTLTTPESLLKEVFTEEMVQKNVEKLSASLTKIAVA